MNKNPSRERVLCKNSAELKTAEFWNSARRIFKNKVNKNPSREGVLCKNSAELKIKKRHRIRYGVAFFTKKYFEKNLAIFHRVLYNVNQQYKGVLLIFVYPFLLYYIMLLFLRTSAYFLRFGEGRANKEKENE